jgi:hypothetical protein
MCLLEKGVAASNVEIIDCSLDVKKEKILNAAAC